MIPLSRRRLEWLLRARGTDLAAWPARERAAALDLMRRSTEARLAFADALTGDDAPEADAGVLGRMQAALRHSLAPLPPLWRGLRAGALILCMAAGLYLASVQAAEPDASPDLFSTAQSVSFAATDP